MGKYQYLKELKIPQEQRMEINQKIEMSLTHRDSFQKREEAFNQYTGVGGLHGLNLADFENFYQYSQAKKEFELGQFFTPIPLVEKIAKIMRINENESAGDFSCGKGTFFNFVPNEKKCFGIEYDFRAARIAQDLFPDATIYNASMETYLPRFFGEMDYVFGNPPFNIKLKNTEIFREEENKYIISQFLYLKLAEKYLKPGGIFALIVPKSFMTDRFMEKKYFNYFDENFSFIGQTNLHEATFKDVGVTDFKTKLIFAHKKTEKIISRKYNENDFCRIDELDSRVGAYQENKRAIKNEIHLEGLREKEKTEKGKQARDLANKIKTYLFHIKVNPKTKHLFQKCFDEVKSFVEHERLAICYQEQLRREGKFVSKERALYTLKQTLLLNNPKKKKPEIFKRKNSIVEGDQEFSISTLVRSDTYPFKDKRYKKFIEKKKRKFLIQEQAFNDMQNLPEIEKYLNDFNIISFGEDLFPNIIKLNQIQKNDLNKIFQKNYGILNWEQGSGKTIAGFSWVQYQLKEKKTVDNVFIIGPAVAINLTWAVRLAAYGEKFIHIDNLSKLRKIKKGDIVIASLDFVGKYKKEIYEYVRFRKNKVALLFDESDEITNYDSIRTQAVLRCFRKAKKKLLTTGTTTRNNITELYPQLELLYNNSINMINLCETLYKKTRSGLEEFTNHHIGTPFPARGQKIFNSCFNPEKKTVFGISKNSQDFYNFKHLQKIIAKTIITRSFDEIAGAGKYEKHFEDDRISQNQAETNVYATIIKEFEKIVYRYFNNTGVYRKESMMKIIRQIQLLIKATSIPHLFSEYEASNEAEKYPNKFYHVLKRIRGWKNEKVAIGTTFVEAAKEYADFLLKYLDRQIFYIDGAVSFKKRGELIAAFEKTKDGILISTQQSLKSSVNIPSCNKVIVESLQWNLPKISQYFFRFIRYDSEAKTDVHFLSYEYSIEQNILALLMSKEALNRMVKINNTVSVDDMLEENGIDSGLFEMIMRQKADEEGKINLTWGKQDVC